MLVPYISLVELGNVIYYDCTFSKFLHACKHCPHDELFDMFYAVSLS